MTEFLTTRKAELLARIGKEKALSDALKAELKAAIDEFDADMEGIRNPVSYG